MELVQNQLFQLNLVPRSIKLVSVQTDLVLIGLIPPWVVWTLVSQALQGHIFVPLKPDGIWNDFLQGLSIIVFQLIFELIFLFLIIENTLEPIGFTKIGRYLDNSAGYVVWIFLVQFLKCPWYHWWLVSSSEGFLGLNDIETMLSDGDKKRVI